MTKRIYREGQSDAHIRSIHAHCKAALDKAVEQGLIYVNPAKTASCHRSVAEKSKSLRKRKCRDCSYRRRKKASTKCFSSTYQRNCAAVSYLHSNGRMWFSTQARYG